MLNLIIGIIWTVITNVLLFMFLVIFKEISMEGNIFMIIFFTVFELIGILLIFGAIKQLIKDKKTNKYGIQCYGIITDVRTTGTYVNGNPQYKAIVDIINPETHQVETCEDVTGFDYNQYPINCYVICKYYNGDINIENSISETTIPEEIKQYLVPIPQESEQPNVEFSSDEEYVTIDGIQYKKVQ